MVKISSLLLFISGCALGFIFIVESSSFGHRCAKMYDKGTPEWEACVIILAEGGLPKPIKEAYNDLKE